MSRSSTRELVDDIVELAEIPAPTFFEDARLAWLERRLDGLAGVRHRDTVGNLIWSFGSGSPRVLVTAHVDTVFASDVPLTVRRVDGRLVGPGVGDNAAAIATVIRVVDELAAAGEAAETAVAFTIGEEGLGNLRGAHAACDELKPATMIAVEGHGLEQASVDAIGSVRARVVVLGSAGIPGSTASYRAPCTRCCSSARSSSGWRRRRRRSTSGVSGGRSVNALADEAWLLVERRSLDEEPLSSFLAELARLAVAPPLTVSVQETAPQPSGRLSRDAPLLRIVQEVRRELHLPDTLVAASTDANAALARGVPALALGVARGSGMHTLDEQIEVDSVETGRLQLELVLRRLLAAVDPTAVDPAAVESQQSEDRRLHRLPVRRAR